MNTWRMGFLLGSVWAKSDSYRESYSLAYSSSCFLGRCSQGKLCQLAEARLLVSHLVPPGQCCLEQN